MSRGKTKSMAGSGPAAIATEPGDSQTGGFERGAPAPQQNRLADIHRRLANT